MNKKAQMHLSETIAVLFIFFVLVFFGLVFYYKYQEVAFKAKQEEYLGARAMDTTLKALFMPELICSRGESEPEDNCVDMMKVDTAAVVIRNNLDYYFDLFSYANITLTQVYPLPSDPAYKPIIIYEKEKVVIDDLGNKVPNWQRRESTFFVVTMKDERSGIPQYSLGYLVVEVYS